MENRIWEIDALRGIAIILMIAYHFFFDLSYFGIVRNAMYTGSWLILQRVTITLFLLLAGVSMHLSFEKMPEKNLRKTIEKFGKRALFLFAIALLISLSTWLYTSKEFIIFGIIHLIALSTLLAVPFIFLNKQNYALAIGIMLVASSFLIKLPAINTPALLWLGFTYPGFASLDYVPLIPWFGLILIGIYLGKQIYPSLESKSKEQQTTFFKLLQFMGRNSLLVYLLHQPILIAILTAYKAV